MACMKSDIDKEIEEARKNLAKLEAHKRSLEERGSKYNYIGKYFVQNMYEAGTRYFHCIGARGEMDELELQGYRVVWYGQSKKFELISKDYPEWFYDINYGELIEVTKEELISTLVKDFTWEIKRILI